MTTATTTRTIDVDLVPGWRPPTVTVRRHRVTASVVWDVHALDVCPYVSDAFDRRCTTLGLPAALAAWWDRHRAGFCYRAELCYSNRWGSARYVTPGAAEELARIIEIVWRKAVLALPDGWPLEARR